MTGDPHAAAEHPCAAAGDPRGTTRTAREQDAGYQVNRVARALRRRLARELEGSGFTGAQAAVLLALAAEDGPAVMSRLAERLGMDRPTLSGVARRLTRDGWVATVANPADGRSRLLRLTARAEEALPALRRASARASSAALAALDAREQSLFIELLDRAARTLEAADAGDRP